MSTLRPAGGSGQAATSVTTLAGGLPGPSLRGDVTVSVCSQVLLLACGLVSGVVTARGLGTSGRGVLALATTIPTVLVVLAGLGTPVASAYLLARGEHSLRTLSRAGATLALLGTAGTTVLLVTVGGTGWDRVWFPGLGRTLLVLAGVLVAPSLLEATLVALLRGSGRLRTASWVELVHGVTATTMTVIVVAVAHAGPTAVVAAAVGGVLAGLVTAGLALRVDGLSLVPRASRSLLGRMLGFGLRADLGNAMHVSGFRLDTFLVNGYVGSAALGVYAVATRFAELIFVLPFAVSLVVLPRGVRARAAGRPDETARVFTWTLLASGAAAGLMALVGGPALTVLYSARFESAYRPMLLLLGGVVAFGATNVLMNDVVGRGRPGLVSLIAAAGLGLTVGLDLWLVPAFGVTGAAVASSVVYLVDAALGVAAYCRVTGRRPASLLVLSGPLVGDRP